MNEVLEHLRRIKFLLKSGLYSKDKLKSMSPEEIKDLYDLLFKTHNSRREIK